MNTTLNKAEIIATLLKEKPRPIFLLGAGASVTSGIPLAGDIVNKASKWAYARQNGKDPDDPRITRSDWYPWLVETQPWFKEDVLRAELFPYAVENLLQPQKARKQFWVKILNPQVKPSIGYLRLAELMHLGFVNTVWTTNFDECMNKARNEINHPAMIEYVKTPSEYVKISAIPNDPLYIYLHGDVNTYSDKNVVKEIERMDSDLVDTLIPILKDHPLIVIGYRGGEPSIMEHLLISHATRANLYKNGIFWCLRKGERPDDATDYVKALASTIGPNFQFIEIESFDHLFDKVIWPHLGEKKIKIERTRFYPSSNVVEPVIVNFDLKNAKIFESEDFDSVLLRIRIMKYCERLKIEVPDRVDNEWLRDQMIHLKLLRIDSSGRIFSTYANLLLFAKNPHDFVKSATIVIKFNGPVDWLRKILDDDSIDSELVERSITGNLWKQLNEINDALSLVNRPFRLKNEESIDVTPYDPIALKEVVVNALVHRNYEIEEPNVIEIYVDRISIHNPGGLIEEVRTFFDEDDMLTEIRKGRRGVKGYRNPVLADLFYGAGAMDKRGSGLYDVVQRVEQNAGWVSFFPDISNASFTVLLRCRPEAIDEITRTATPLRVIASRFTSNILEVQQLPEYVSYSVSEHKSHKDVFSRYKSISFPPFELHNGNLFSLTDLKVKHNTLRNLVDTQGIQYLALDEFMGGIEGERRFVKLLNDSFSNHCFRKGMIVDKFKSRVYFTKEADGERVIAYKARFKKAKRAVAKPRYSANKEKIIYWEHKAFNFSFRRFGEQWGLHIEPTYVFTLDGKKDLLASARVGALATKKMSRDYNQNVMNDLIFWLRMLSSEPNESFVLHSSSSDGLMDNIVMAPSFASAALNNVEVVEGEFEDLEERDEDDDEVDPEIADIADKQREGIIEDDYTQD